MTRLQWVTRVVKPAAFVGAMVPLAALLAAGFLGGDLGPDPVRHIQHVTGISCLALLGATLSITPLRRHLRLGELIRLRRMLGLWAFTYAALHLLTYVVFDQSLDPGRIWADTLKHPRIYLGFAAFLILLALALTSTDASVRRLGRRWVTLHRLIYIAVLLGIVHFAMVQKLDIRTPLAWGAGFGVLMLLRIRRPARRAGPLPATSTSD
ncbi:MAG TPA: protein-methionine-sulfoxide reductase heme-binding subunit MsrQ [Gemmatimonadales bacterium]|nr:protein-methionine-sulfoxide reductase heme-binding subunit MsrQ [Gemmatimonadales bacterium]